MSANTRRAVAILGFSSTKTPLQDYCILPTINEFRQLSNGLIGSVDSILDQFTANLTSHLTNSPSEPVSRSDAVAVRLEKYGRVEKGD